MTATARRVTPPAIWILLGGQVVIRAAGFAYPFMSYLLDGRDYGPAAIEWVLATFGVGWVVGQLLCGWLIDRIGRRTTLVAAMLLAAVALPLLGTAQSLRLVVAGSFLAGLIYDASRPVISAAVADMIPDDADRAWINGWRHFTLNVGAAIAGAVGGLLAGSLGIPALYLINAAACAVFAMITLVFIDADAPVRPERGGDRGYQEAFADARLWLLVLSSVGALVPVLGMLAALPLLMTADDLPPSDFGAVQVANAVTVLVITPLINPWMSRRAAADRPMLREVAASSLLMGVAMGGVALADSAFGYGLAVVASIPGEVVWFIAVADVLNRIAPARLRGLYNGVWGMTLAFAGVLTPLLTAWALDNGGQPMAGAAIAAAGVFGAVCCLPLARAVRHKPSVRTGVEQVALA